MKKLLLGLVTALLLLAAGCAFFFWGRGPEAQMKTGCDLLFTCLRSYRFDLLRQEDPVESALAQTLGEEKPQSAAWLYDTLKEHTSHITWEVLAVSPETASAQVEVTYPDAGSGMDSYAEGLAEQLVSGVAEGTISLGDDLAGLTFLDDEENLTLLRTALEGAECPDATAVVTVSFTRKYGIWFPDGVSDEVRNVVSAGLSSRMTALPDEVAALAVSGIVEHMFGLIQSFDTEALESLTGQSMSQLIGVREDSPLYEPLLDYLRSCAAQLTYTVQPLDTKTCSVAVDCQYPDSQSVLQAYLEGLGAYMATHLSDPIPDDAASSQLMEEAVKNAAGEGTVSKTVVITFEQGDYSRYTVSEEIRDVVSANLYSEVSDLLKAIQSAQERSASLFSGLAGFAS